MANIYELYGRQAETFEAEKAAHLTTIDALKRVALGEVLPAQLLVTADTWRIVDPPAPEPDEEPELMHPSVLGEWPTWAQYNNQGD